MSLLKFLFAAILTFIWVVLLNFSPAALPYVGKSFSNSALASMPPMGKFLNPFNGFWQNAEVLHPSLPKKNVLEQLQAPVKVVYDDRLVPHIFAENDNDLYFMQGYVTAQLRLWQMEFQTHASAGRLSEIVGKKAINYDREQRHKGMITAAENALNALNTNSTTKNIVQAYTQGVNAYINSLSYKTMPFEYKLLNYQPEPWTPLKSALLLKYMADDLTGGDNDLEMTNAYKLLGNTDFNALFPDFPKGIDPIIPVDADADFQAIASPKQPQAPKDTLPKTPTTNHPDENILQDLLNDSTTSLLPLPHRRKPEPSLGSNNWAVAPSKTATGQAILCNDPHLGLNLPSIWFEIQLHSPNVNVYGVSLPGSPCVVIGFNENITWGVTNGSRDVKDWYKIQFKNAARKEYKYNNAWKKTTQRIETIKVRFADALQDTVIYTDFGPIVYDYEDNKNKNLAMHWKALDQSDELLTFYQLNRAANYDDYVNALKHYECPAQNFAYADAAGNIAIWQQGKFPLKWRQQGKFLLDGTFSGNEWQSYIPQSHNPHVKNPERGFISSANQHPTDSLYPYYYNGNFEYYRNRRLNQQLVMAQDITVQDMKDLQTDNYNLQAAESLKALLGYIDTTNLNKEELNTYHILNSWDFFNNPDLIAPSMYKLFWGILVNNLWDELKTPDSNTPLLLPKSYITNQLLVLQPNSKFMDIKSTPQKETATELVQISFKQAVDSLQNWADATKNDRTWAAFKGTDVRHLARIPALGIENINVGGDAGILNAVTPTNGPSWRMIVAIGNKTEAFGVYPGGQSGNPGSRYYTNFMEKWIAGDYFNLLFMKDEQNIEAAKVLTTQIFSPN